MTQKKHETCPNFLSADFVPGFRECQAVGLIEFDVGEHLTRKFCHIILKA